VRKHNPTALKRQAVCGQRVECDCQSRLTSSENHLQGVAVVRGDLSELVQSKKLLDT
jgi:hypothetical protein